MSRSEVTLEAVIEAVSAEGLVPAEAAGRAEAVVERLHGVQPWYLRAMVGLGAWLASLLLIGFLAGLGLAIGGSTVLGLVLVGAAVWLRRRPAVGDNDFVVQCTLAASLAGQGLLNWGIADLLGGTEVKSFCLAAIVVGAVLFFVFPDRVHRVLMVLFAAGALTTLAYAFELNGLVPVLGPAFAGALVLLYRNRSGLASGPAGPLVRPLANGLMLSAFGCLLLSTVYLLPELGAELSIYPRPWISTLLLGALFLHVGAGVRRTLLGGRGGAPAVAVHALMLAVVAASWLAPGILLALVVVMLGAASGHRTFVGAGTAFLVVFVGAYFYGIEVTMLAKSATLVGCGLAILLARWVLLRVLEEPAHA